MAAQGINKQIRYKKQTALGVPAPGGTGGQILRSVTSSLNLEKETYESKEKRPDAQVADFRHGVRSVSGGLNGEFSPGTYADMFANILRRDFTAGATTGALTNVTAASTGPSTGTFTRATGSYITDGFNVGDVVRWTGWATTGVPNNAHNMLIIGLTATVMTALTLDGVAIGAKAAGDSVTGVVTGKKTFAPVTALTDGYLTFEHWFSDIAQSEVFTDCKVGGFDIKLPATGLAELSFEVMGLNMTPGTSAYFVAPTAQSGSGVFAAVNGAVLFNGAVVASITSLSIKGSANLGGEAVVGSNVKPEVTRGRTVVDGEITALFENAVYRDLFLNETETAIVFAMTTANTPAADFVCLVLPRVKLGGNSKDDGEKSLIQTMPFKALLNFAGGTGTNSEKTTFSIQDSLA